MGAKKRDTGHPGDVKQMKIAGCTVRLTFIPKDKSRWSVNGTVECGIHEHRHAESIQTGTYHSREEAEQAAIGQVTALLGHNEDRSTSRVRNWN